jgi:hypothetical protein
MNISYIEWFTEQYPIIQAVHTTMPTYRFHVGQRVEMVPEDRFSPRGVFEIVRLLPPRDGEFQYRIKSIDEPHERVAKESLLRRL